MRKSKLADSLFPIIRQQILAATLLQPDRSWYLSDLARHLGRSPSSLQRELRSLVAAGILRRRAEGKQVYFQADVTCPIYIELRGLLLKSVGLVDVLHKALSPVADRIIWAFVYGSVARAEEVSASDIDLMVIGSVRLFELASLLRRATESLGREINPTTYTETEVVEKLRTGHHFLRSVFTNDKLFVYGSPDELATTFEQPARATAPDKQPGTRRPTRRRRS